MITNYEKIVIKSNRMADLPRRGCYITLVIAFWADFDLSIALFSYATVNAFFFGRTEWKKGRKARGARQKGRYGSGQRWRTCSHGFLVQLVSSRRCGKCIVRGKVRSTAALTVSPPNPSYRRLCYRSASGGILKAAVHRARSGVRRNTCNRAHRMRRVCHPRHQRVVCTRDRFESTSEMRLVTSQD